VDCIWGPAVALILEHHWSDYHQGKINPFITIGYVEHRARLAYLLATGLKARCFQQRLDA
jgi:hypothetical protein